MLYERLCQLKCALDIQSSDNQKPTHALLVVSVKAGKMLLLGFWSASLSLSLC